MTISKEKVREIAKKHLILSDTEAEDAFYFVWEILCAEYDAIKEESPWATNSLQRLEHAEHEVYDLIDEVAEAVGE